MSDQIRAGRQLGGRYTLLALIARGGMGEVWRARDSLTGTQVAAKVLRSELTGEEVSLSRLRLEARNAMSAKHPNIATVLDSGEEDAQGWLIMEMVHGRPLTEYIGDGLTLTPAQLLPILIQTAYALDAAARADVVHRDIKPANILIKRDGMVKLTDFGVSIAAGQVNLTAAGMVMGTAQYLPPEQALGKVATPVGDLYALGVIAFEALAGHRPYTGETQVDIAFAHVNEDIPPLPNQVPEPLADLVRELLVKDPESRPQTGAALARKLTGVAEDLGLATAPLPLPEPADTNDGAARPDTKSSLPATRGTPTAPPATHPPRQWAPVDGGAKPRALPSRRTETTVTNEPANSGKRLWALIVLAVLSVVIILVIVGRNQEASSLERDRSLTQSHELQEVQQWLTPLHVA